MVTLAYVFRVGWGELLVLTVIGGGVLALMGLVVFIAVKVGQNSK